MRIQDRHLIAIGVLAAVVWLTCEPLTRPAVALPPKTPPRPVPAREASGDSASALIFPQDRQIEQSLTAVATHLDAREFASAASLLEQLLDSPTESFVSDGGVGTVVSSRQRAQQLMDRLPAENRARLESDLDRMAREAWTGFKGAPSLEDVAAFANRYRLTQPGLEALQMIAFTYRDTSRHELAAFAFGRMIDHPRATPAQRVSSILAKVDSLLILGRRDEAQQVAATYATLLKPEPTTMIGGRSVAPQQYVTQRLKIGGESSTTKDATARESDDAVRLPGLKRIWSRNTGALTDVQKLMPGVQRYFREQGVVSSPVVRPVVAGNVVLARTMEALWAFDLATGETLWSVPNQEYGWIGRQNLALSASHVPMIAGAWHRRMEADSVFNSLTTDGRLVVVVQEPDRFNLDFAVPHRSGVQNGVQGGVRWNRLFAYSVSSRDLRWQIGGEPRGPSDVYGGMTFLGGGLFIDDLLDQIGRRDDELRLLAIDRDTGHLRWSLGLGILPPHLADLVSRRRMECPISRVNGLLLCPTNSGSLIAVDPITRSIEWAFRYAVVQHNLPIRPVNGSAPHLLPDAWWNEWREVNCLTGLASAVERSEAGKAADRERRITVLASPDSNLLQGLDADSGAPLWSVPRSGALHLAGVWGDLAIVIEPMAVRAQELRTGTLRWRIDTGEISARATIAGSLLIQPLRMGGYAVIDLKSGKVRTVVGDPELVTGTLIPCDDGWVSQTDQSLFRLPFLDDLRRQAEEKWQTSNDEASAVALAELDLQSGDPSAARKRLEHVDSRQARELRRKSIVALLKRSGGNGSEAPASQQVMDEMSRELLNLCESDEDRLIVLRTLGESALAARDSVNAMTLFLDGLELIDSIGLRSLGDWSPNETSSRGVRPDRVLLGAIEQILDDADDPARDDSGSSERRRDLETILQGRLAAARRSDDPFALQRLMDRLRPLEWGRRALVADPSAVLFGRSLVKAEPALLSAMGSRDRGTSVRAAYHLAQLCARSGWRTEEEAIERRLQSVDPGMPIDGNQTLAAKLAADPNRGEELHRLNSAPADPWPNLLPDVEKSQKDSKINYYQVPARVQAAPGSLLDRLDVCVDRQGRTVRFIGEGHAKPWEVQLPNSPRPLRASFANHGQLEAYGVGQLLVLRVGSEVFGILPLNDHGEPNQTRAVTRLQFDMAPAGEFGDATWWQEIAPEKPGIRHLGVRFVDSFGHDLGGLGPVRAGYLCYRSQARLVAMDTQSGVRLWERLDLPPHCRAFGDEERVYLWRTEERSLDVLSAIDGRLLEQRGWDASPDDVLMQRDSRTWLVSRGTATGVELVDARDGGTVWSRQFPPNSVPFAMDDDTIGVVDPNQLLHILSADTGAPLGEAMTIEVPQKIERIVCLRDAYRWYVAVSGPVPRLPVLQAEQIWGGLHLAFVNGWLYGIDRQSTAISWRRFLDSESVPLVTSRNAPVLVQLWRKSFSEKMSGPNAAGILRLIDKRTGQEIFTAPPDSGLQPYYTLQASEKNEMLKIHTDRETIQLNYKPKTQEPGPQNNSDKN